MKARVIEINWTYEVQNCIQDTRDKVIWIIDIPDNVFNVLINCGLDNRIKLINQILDEGNNFNWE